MPDSTDPSEVSETAPAEQSEPTEDEIRTTAYFIWTERVFYGLDGDDKRDWFQAQEFLRNGGRNPDPAG